MRRQEFRSRFISNKMRIMITAVMLILVTALWFARPQNSIAAAGYPWWLVTTTNTDTSGSSGIPSTGIWEIDNDNLEISLMPFYTTPTAGVWRVNSAAEVVPGSTKNYDAIWTTNTSGHIILREIP